MSKGALVRLHEEMLQRAEIKIDSGCEDALVKILEYALDDIIDLGPTAGGYLGRAGSYSGSKAQQLSTEWLSMYNCALKIKSKLERNEIKFELKSNCWGFGLSETSKESRVS